MRLFIALELPLEVKNLLKNRWKKYRKEYPNLKWTPYGNLHVTLRFLGELNPESVIARMSGLDLERFLPVKLDLNQLGTFGSPPSVLWLGGSFSSGLVKAAELLGEITDENGDTNGRRFIPHITIARVRPGESLPEIPFSMKVAGSANRISLFSSHLYPFGPVYKSHFSVTS